MSVPSEKLVQIRKLIADSNLDAYLVAHSDPHLVRSLIQSEYLPGWEERVKFISGFSGSNALCFISQKDAFMWTDGRYFIQAEEELESGWQMMKMGVSKDFYSGEMPWNEFVKENYPAGTKIGYNPSLIAADVADKRKKFFSDNGMEAIAKDDDLVEKLWTDRPKDPENPIFIHPAEFTGEDVPSKIKRVSEKCSDKKINYFLTSTLDEIAWVLNIRGNDIPCTPVGISNLVLNIADKSKSSGTLFIDKKKVPAEVEKYLNDNGIQVEEYTQTVNALSALEGKIGLWKTECNSKLVSSIKEDSIIDIQSPIYHLKGIKNAREIQGMKESNIRDCAALAAFFSFLHTEIVVKKRTDLSEIEAADKVSALRSQIKWFKELSFEVIAAVGGNAAMAHYQPKPGKCSNLDINQIFLLDSGAQYLFSQMIKGWNN